jgi:RNA polymerase sigma factor (sigma-70 family)
MAHALTAAHDQVIRKQARRFAARGLNSRTLDVEDYVQAAYVRLLSHVAKAGDVEAPIATLKARAAMRDLDEQEYRRSLATDAEAGNPRRRTRHVEDSATRLDVAAAVAELSPKLRQAVAAAYWFDMTGEEAAKALGVPAARYHGRIKWAKAALRESLGRPYESWARKCPRKYVATLPNQRGRWWKNEAELAAYRKERRPSTKPRERRSLWESISHLQESRSLIRIHSG